MRLDKFLSDSTDMSRKDIKEIIKKKRVSLNGAIVTKADIQVDERADVCVDGVAVPYKRFVYLVMNKPQGYVSATEDRDYKTVIELLPEEYSHFDVFPAGRLDIDTEGLLILTNDGSFAHNVTSPKKNVYKRYFARLDKPAEDEDVAVFRAGMEFKEFTAKSAKLELCENPNEAFVEIAEGKYHQVKRMFERVGKTVVYLKRVAIGNLQIPDKLGLGEVMEMSCEEMEQAIFK